MELQCGNMQLGINLHDNLFIRLDSGRTHLLKALLTFPMILTLKWV